MVKGMIKQKENLSALSSVETILQIWRKYTVMQKLTHKSNYYNVTCNTTIKIKAVKSFTAIAIITAAF